MLECHCLTLSLVFNGGNICVGAREAQQRKVICRTGASERVRAHECSHLRSPYPSSSLSLAAAWVMLSL